MSDTIKVVQVGAVGAAAAQASAAAAQVLLNTFRGAFYGALAADPAQDPNGDAPGAGDAYYSTATGKLRVYSGAAWGDYDQAAQQAAANAAATLATFLGAFYGALAADPAQDPNGDAPDAGDAYYSTATGKLRVFSGAAWADYDQAAQQAAANAAATLATFLGAFYGALAADPAQDPNGDAPDAGDAYYSTATGKLRVFSGAAWADYDQAAQQAAANAAATLATFRGAFYGALAADPEQDPNGDAPSLGDAYYSTVNGKLRVYGATGWADYDQAAQDAAAAAAGSEQRAAESAAAASGSVSGALALYGGAGALEAAVGEADGFAQTATAQAALAQGYAAAAASVVQQDLSGAVALALHRGAGTIVAFCIDDPRLWPDGGAALDRISGLSYQRETLNGKWLGWLADEAAARAVSGAATGDYFGKIGDGKFYRLSAGAGTTETFRGNRANYGRMAWIAETSRVVGYAIDEPGCPMWMVVLSTGGSGSYGLLFPGGGYSFGSITAYQGSVYVGCPGGAGFGLQVLDFLADKGLRYAIAAYAGVFRGTIAQRNQALGHDLRADMVITSGMVNAVATCVMPDAPCAPTTGLQVPTVAAFTAAGVSLIQNNGAVANSASTGNFVAGSITPYLLSAVISGGTNWNYAFKPGALGAGFALAALGAGGAPGFNFSGQALNQVFAPTRRLVVSKFANRLTAMIFNESNPGASLVAQITDTYNTGWWCGDVRRAYLADTAVGVVSDAELVIDGVMNNPASVSYYAIQDGNVTRSISGGVLNVSTNVNAGSDSVYYGPMPTEPGVQYTVTADFSAVANCTGGYFNARNGSNTSAGVMVTQIGNNVPGNASLTPTLTFIADGPFTMIRLGMSKTQNDASCKWDNLSTKAVGFADRSYKAARIKPHSTLARTKVGGVSVLSGFSNTNYLQEAAPSTDLDPATGALDAGVFGSLPATLDPAIFPEASGELIVNGGFDSDTAWTKGANWTISGGVASHAAGAAGSMLQGAATAGKFYKVTWTVSGASNGATNAIAGGTTGPQVLTLNGTYTQIVKAIGGQAIGVTCSTVFDGSIDNVSVKEVGPLIAFDRSAATGALYRFGVNPDGTLVGIVGDGTTTRSVTSPASYLGVRFKGSLSYGTDGTLALNVNGVQVAATTGNPLASLSNAAAVLTVGNSRDLNAPWPDTLALLKIGMTIPSAEQSQFAYDTERQMFADGAVCTLPDSGSVVDMHYDPALDRLKVASAANESTFVNLVRVSSSPAAAGSISKVTNKSGIKLIARTGVNPGVDITLPPKNLQEELNRRDQVRARIPERRLFEADATASQTSFRGLLPVGWEVESVAWGALANGATLRREGASKDWQRQFDGFVEWPVANTGLAAGTSVQVMGRRAVS